MNTSRTTSLAIRHRTPEIMDDPALEPRAHDDALRGLERIHRFSRPDVAIWPRIARLYDELGNPDQPLRVLDVACGGGVLALELVGRAAREGRRIDVEGCDKSPRAVEFAARRARETGRQARFFACDALADPFPGLYDVVTCSLFLHHLDAADAEKLLGRMAAAAKRLVLVDDLIRNRAGYLLAWLGCRALSRSPVVHSDGAASVAAAYNVDEAIALARCAGLDGATVARHWPCRFLLSWSPP